MHDRPDAIELLDAVRQFLAEEVVPATEDPRQRFRTLVAINALAIARRELEATDEGPDPAELRELARRIRAGDAPEDAVASLKEFVAAKLRVASPDYLERYR